MGKRSVGTLARQMFDFYGPTDFLRMGARYAKVKLLRKVAALNHNSEWHDLSGLCGAYGLKVMTQDNLHQPEILDLLRGLDLDLIVSVAAPSIFKPALIEVPKLGCINIHHAPLPRYRGMMPNFWQLYHGEKTVGITIHRINPKIDEGEILLQRMVPVEPPISYESPGQRFSRRC